MSVNGIHIHLFNVHEPSISVLIRHVSRGQFRAEKLSSDRSTRSDVCLSVFRSIRYIVIDYNYKNFTLRFILHAKKTGFVVEHDFIMATYLADRVIVFSGVPSLDTTAHCPQSLLNGMNRFLELLGITFRRDPNNFRPRINKSQSVKVCTH